MHQPQDAAVVHGSDTGGRAVGDRSAREIGYRDVLSERDQGC